MSSLRSSQDEQAMSQEARDKRSQLTKVQVPYQGQHPVPHLLKLLPETTTFTVFATLHAPQILLGYIHWCGVYW